MNPVTAFGFGATIASAPAVYISDPLMILWAISMGFVTLVGLLAEKYYGWGTSWKGDERHERF